MHGMQEVTGSIPVFSTRKKSTAQKCVVLFCCHERVRDQLSRESAVLISAPAVDSLLRPAYNRAVSPRKRRILRERLVFVRETQAGTGMIYVIIK